MTAPKMTRALKVLRIAKPVTLGGIVWTVTAQGTEEYPHWCVVWRRWDLGKNRYWGQDVRDYLDYRYLHPKLRAAMGMKLPTIPQPRTSR